jgi:hypothetical protein
VSGEARVSLTITNSGKRRGTEVVQLYVADTATGVTLHSNSLASRDSSSARRIEDRHV